MVGRQVGGFDLPFQSIDGFATNTAFQGFREFCVDDLRQAAEFTLDRLGLADKA